ncbi:MAG: TlpA family protein disulfide reductase, partial [Deltaproteobacteria bacterium]|nr:TlpA family protein disulfide reductase [Deltaproteobacteria bacterium]
MTEKICLIIGETKDFKSAEITELAKKGGEPQYFDSCDLQEAFGPDALDYFTKNDLLTTFRDDNNVPVTNPVLKERLDFFKDYSSSMETLGATLEPGNWTDLFDEYFSTASRLHGRYNVPFFENDKRTYVQHLQYYLERQDFDNFERTFLWGCQSDYLPDDLVLNSHLFLMHYAVMIETSIMGGRGNAAINLANRCLAEASSERKARFDEMGITQDLAETNESLARSEEKQAASAADAAGQFKVGDKINVPEITKALKGNGVTILFGWASWCPACRMAMPTINKLADELRKKGVNIVGATTEPVSE